MEVNNILKEKIKHNLDFIVHRLHIDVKVCNNQVTIKGVVNSLYEKEIIENIAWNTDDVEDVNNELLILN